MTPAFNAALTRLRDGDVGRDDSAPPPPAKRRLAVESLSELPPLPRRSSPRLQPSALVVTPAAPM
eukprot:5069-Pelagococcus_subviridis.AAC.1